MSEGGVRRKGAGVIRCVALLADIAGSGPADAAVRICKEMIAGDEMKARTQIEARRLALQHWTMLAGLHGEGFMSWRLAGNRMVSCRLLGDGLHYCQARGAPCTISQVAPPVGPRLPAPGTPPVPRPPAPKDGLRI